MSILQVGDVFEMKNGSKWISAVAPFIVDTVLDDGISVTIKGQHGWMFMRDLRKVSTSEALSTIVEKKRILQLEIDNLNTTKDSLHVQDEKVRVEDFFKEFQALLADHEVSVYCSYRGHLKSDTIAFNFGKNHTKGEWHSIDTYRNYTDQETYKDPDRAYSGGNPEDLLIEVEEDEDDNF